MAVTSKVFTVHRRTNISRHEPTVWNAARKFYYMQVRMILTTV